MTPTIRKVIFVSYDSVRADVAYNGRMRGIEALRDHGVVFESCVASAPYTPVSHATVFTGLQPYHHGIRHLFREKLAKGCQTVASLLAERGWSTSAVVSCPGLASWYEIGRGFQIYDDEIPRLPDGSDPLQTVDVKLRGRAMKRAPVVIERSRAMLRAAPADRVLHFLHFFDAHWPYEAPEADPGAANAYEAEVRYLDEHFLTWFTQMRAEGRLDDTLLVLFGDHGEDLDGWYPNDKGGEELGHPEELGHGSLLYDQTVLVPLIVHHPAFAPRVVRDQVRLVDIAPSVLDLVGLPSPQLDGVSLAPTILDGAPVHRRPAYIETHYPREQVETTGQYPWIRNKKAIRIANRYKVIFHLESDVVEVYDLKEDPHEHHDLLGG